MRIQIIAVGTRMPKWVEQGTHEYLNRFNNDISVSFTEIASKKRGKNYSIAQIIEDEGKRIIEAIPSNNKVIALEVTGRSWNTAQLAENLSKWQMRGVNISMMIGGPEGLSQSCKDLAEQKWSLSALTLPHPLVRVIVSEALYRAWSLMHNHPYHRA